MAEARIRQASPAGLGDPPDSEVPMVRPTRPAIIAAYPARRPRSGGFRRASHVIAPENTGDLPPPDRTRSDVCHAAAFMSISAWAWAGVLYPTPECRRRLL